MVLNKDFILRTRVCYTHYTALLPLRSDPSIRCLELFPCESFFFSIHASPGKPQKGCIRTEGNNPEVLARADYFLPKDLAARQ